MSALGRLGIDTGDRFVNQESTMSANQRQTKETFGYKWGKRETYESNEVKAKTTAWLLERYCDNDPYLIPKWLEGERKIILDAGCGAGLTGLLMFGDYLTKHDYLGVDISSAVEVAKIRFQENGRKGDFLQRSLTDLDDIPDSSIDIIFSEGVLHHTDNTEFSFKYLTKKLRSGGRFLFYVYAQKAVIREFTDDYIREEVGHLSDEEAWKALEPLTKLGRALGELNVDLDVPEDIPFLGIMKGKVNLQRFFYWNICKLYYRPEYSINEMNHINFDWFRPVNCHRHTPEEVIGWCNSEGLNIEHINVQESGITVVAQKK